MKILQSRSFERKVKKFGKQEKKAIDKQILKIAENSSYLLSYRFVGADLELIMIGPHENYYRDLKNYLKAR
ncbi:MAG: type II toxin-antitoxin system RelE/ParE family toxin [Deltaproteobacteria bacterium]|nr:type II toxin-antitoxin system RelE/ParE family toxin [Deltaproteobacteria bacterium]